MKTALVVPTYNPGAYVHPFLSSLQRQTLIPDEMLVIDSESTDGSLPAYTRAGFQLLTIAKEDFNHGGSRHLAVMSLLDADVIIFMTQDAVLANDDALANILDEFSNDAVACAYGRQLPHQDATPFAAHLRFFNYPPTSMLKSCEDIPRLGLKTAFMSNSFAAYRREPFLAVGGFPSSTIVSEDTYVAAKLLLAGYRIAYCADASVYHSHNYSWRNEFRRYFDIGVFHAQESWIRIDFGAAEGEGRRFIASEYALLRRHAPWLLPSSFIRSFLKYIGYRLGLCEYQLPTKIKKKLSMHPDYWDD